MSAEKKESGGEFHLGGDFERKRSQIYKEEGEGVKNIAHTTKVSGKADFG